jgi:hypothetical protein
MCDVEFFPHRSDDGYEDYVAFGVFGEGKGFAAVDGDGKGSREDAKKELPQGRGTNYSFDHKVLKLCLHKKDAEALIYFLHEQLENKSELAKLDDTDNPCVGDPPTLSDNLLFDIVTNPKEYKSFTVEFDAEDGKPTRISAERY